MAAAYKHFQSIFSISNSYKIWGNESFRLYSQYAPHFREPIIDKNNLEEFLKLTPQPELVERQTKAAGNDQTCSVFYDEEIRKVTNHICKKGNKNVARKILEDALTIVKHTQLRKFYAEEDETKRNEIIVSPRVIFHLALKNLTPVVRVERIKKSGTWYTVPVGVTKERAQLMAIQWLLQVCKEKNKVVPFEKQLAQELISAAHYEGPAIKKKIEMHKLCEANRGYAHYRWT